MQYAKKCIEAGDGEGAQGLALMAMQLNADGNEDLVLKGLDAAKDMAEKARNKAM